ncbi:hypothetical protein MTY66_34900 [Mycolicibacterium sp. TY66]|nr:hypothetical protein MTY66_34900 [Mycolicibacterium sp. TY66]BCJ80486.1 hypothetical protein MTY81_18590 [Mycolicibacterium sp. TY81]
MRDCPDVGVDALSGELKIDLETLSWSAASVPPLGWVHLPAHGDPVSLMLSSYIPGLVDGANEKVAAAQAEDQAFAGKVSSAKSAYQNADDAGGQTIQKAAGDSLNPASAAGKVGGGADGGMGQFGQMMGMAMQAFQAPAQAMQALGSVPQTAMQAAQQIGQQVQQLAGQAGKDGAKPADAGTGGVGGAAGQQLKPEERKPGDEKAREEKRDEKPEENKDREADKKHAAAGPSSGPAAPVPPSKPAPRSGRHAANPAVDV